MKNPKLRAFKIVSSEIETIAAYTNLGALLLYCSITEASILDFSGSDEIVEIPQSEWPNYTITLGDVQDESAPIITLMEAMESLEEPEYLCTSCF